MVAKKKIRDPLAPKLPLSSYMEFAKEERSKVIADLGPLTIGESGKELGRRWTNLTAELKDKYEKIGSTNRETFSIQMEEYKTKKKDAEAYSPAANDTFNKKDDQPCGSKKKARDPLAPKLPLSSYMEFAMEERSKVVADLGQLTIGESGKELGRRWTNLTTELKSKFEQKGRTNKERFGLEMAEYKTKKHEAEAHSPTANETCNKNDDEPSGSSVLSSTISSVCSSFNPDPNIPGSVIPPSSIPEHPRHESVIPSSSTFLPKPEDLGFAKQKGFSWHPAFKTGVLARGTRVKVTYFGTGQTGTVDASKWLKFSNQAEQKVTTPRLLKDAAFKKGLDQLRVLLAKVLDPEIAVTSSGISFADQPVERRLRKLDKDGLQKEEEENSRRMREKIVERDGSPNKWGCRIATGKENSPTRPRLMPGTVELGRRSTSRK